MSKPIAWEARHIRLAPGEDWYDCIRANGANGWEPWHMERSDNGHRTIYFKRPKAATVSHRMEIESAPSTKPTQIMSNPPAPRKLMHRWVCHECVVCGDWTESIRVATEGNDAHVKVAS